MSDLNAWMGATSGRVEAALTRYFEEKLREIEVISPSSLELGWEVQALTMRGGKRFRALLACAGHRAVDPAARPEDSDALGASLELLQSYLLIHDDWMDGDDTRRDGPSTHAAFRARGYERHLANSLAILAGDLASTYAWELFLRAPFTDAERAAATERFLTIQKEVYLGQHLDTTASADVARMHDLKTGSYTVRGPLLLGAHLGAPSAAQLEALTRYSAPLGEAFQIADDLIGTFGRADATGKPGDDLDHRKRNALIFEAEAHLEGAQREAIDRLMQGPLADPAADAAVVEAARAALIEGGIRERVVARLDQLLVATEAALEAPVLSEGGRAILLGLAQKLVKRAR